MQAETKRKAVKAMMEAKRSAAQQVVELIQEGIKKGRYPVGQALPGQRQLAEETGVSRTALREAISSLEGAGLLTVQPGKGVFVNKSTPDAPRWRYESRYSLDDVYTVRATLESLSAQLAAQNASRKEIDSLDELVRELAEATERSDLTAMAAADRQFHRRLAEISGNPLLHEMLDAFDSVITESKNFAFLDTSGKNHREVLAEHREIVAALKCRDGAAACRCIRNHITNAHSRAERVKNPSGH
jgi:GntR family transcriptional repressor for pyruvate dehydrogenase complex